MKTEPPWVLYGKLIGLLVSLALIWWAATTIIGWKKAAETNAQTVQQQNATADATGQIGTAVSTGTSKAKADVAAAETARSEYVYRYREAIKNDPQAAAFDSTPVPVSLRDAARARRELLDRLADDEVGSRRTD